MKKRKILLVDENKETLEFISNIFGNNHELYRVEDIDKIIQYIF